MLRAAGLAVLLTGAAACSGTEETTGPVLEVTSFGAVGDGRADDTAALQRGLAALKPGETLRLGAGRVFRHSVVLKVTTPGVRLVGPGTLLAVHEESSALQVQAAHVTLRDLRLAVAGTTRRWSTPDQHKLVLGAYEGITVRDVTILGSAAAGLFCLGTYSFTLQGVQVFDTRADGIHMTGGAKDGRVLSPRITRSGDDGVAVVSYLDDHQPCRNITVLSPRVRTTTGGRGISVVGGQHITYRDIDIDASSAAAVYVACEGGDSVTFPSEHVRVAGGRITHANSNGSIDHGAVLVYAGRREGDVTDVRISDLEISGTRAGASRQIGTVSDQQDPVSDIRFTGLRLAASPTPYQGNAPSSAVVLEDVTAAGASVTAAR